MDGSDQTFEEILSIAAATRAGAHLLISLFGPPESGKTVTALKLARGLAGPAGKIGFLDTESGRGRLNADAIQPGYDIGELSPPFTAERYVAAIRQFERAGYPVLIVDSFSHVWSGEGGVLEQADKSGAKGLQKWLQPKLRYKRLMNCLLGTKMHIIFCSRAKQPMKEETVNGKKELVRGDWIEVQDAQLRYEMTLVLQMEGRGKFKIVKCPGALDPVFAGFTVLDESAGAKIAKWVGGGDPVDPAFEALRVGAVDAAERGNAALDVFIKGLAREQKAAIAPLAANLRSIAKTADEDAEQDRRDRATPSDDPFEDAGEPVTIGEATAPLKVETASTDHAAQPDAPFVLWSADGEELRFDDPADLPTAYRLELNPMWLAGNGPAMKKFDAANLGLLQVLTVSHPEIASQISAINAQIRPGRAP